MRMLDVKRLISQAVIFGGLLAVGYATAAEPEAPSAREIALEEVISNEPWFLSYEGENRTLEYAAQVMDGHFKPRSDVPSWSFSHPIDWKADPFKDNNWQFLLHAFYMLDPLLFAELQSDDTKYLLAALEIVEDWSTFHFADGREAPFSWYNMAVGMRSGKIAYLHQQLRTESPAVLTPAYEEMFLNLAQEHISRVISGEIPLRMTNHGLFQLHGLVALCREFDLAACQQVTTFVREGLSKVVEAQFDEEGMHLEHSPGYHRFALDKIDSLISSGWYSDYPVLVETSALAHENMFWLLDPGDAFWGIGDTVSTVYSAAGEVAVPSNNCADGGSPSSPDFVNRCVLMREFDAGYVAIRTVPAVEEQAGSGLFFQGAFHSSVHKHLDDLTFELYEQGRRIIVDSGFFGYLAHPMRRYMQSTRAHNTVEIDQTDFSRASEYAYGSAIQEAARYGDYFVIRGRVEHHRPVANHSRQLLYRPGRWLLIRDWVGGGSQRPVTQWLHFAPGTKVLATTDHGAVFELDNIEFRVESLSSCPVELIRGQKEPRLQGWYSPSQGKSVPNYAMAARCESGHPIEIMITFSDGAREKLVDRIDKLRARHLF